MNLNVKPVIATALTLGILGLACQAQAAAPATQKVKYVGGEQACAMSRQLGNDSLAGRLSVPEALRGLADIQRQAMDAEPEIYAASIAMLREVSAGSSPGAQAAAVAMITACQSYGYDYWSE